MLKQQHEGASFKNLSDGSEGLRESQLPPR